MKLSFCSFIIALLGKSWVRDMSLTADLAFVIKKDNVMQYSNGVMCSNNDNNVMQNKVM